MIRYTKDTVMDNLVTFFETLENEDDDVGDVSQFQDPEQIAVFDPQHALSLLKTLLVDKLHIRVIGDWTIEQNWEKKTYASLQIHPPKDWSFISEAKVVVKLEPDYYGYTSDNDRNILTCLEPKIEVTVGGMWSLVDLPSFNGLFYDRYKRTLVTRDPDSDEGISYNPPAPPSKTKKKR